MTHARHTRSKTTLLIVINARPRKQPNYTFSTGPLLIVRYSLDARPNARDADNQ